MRVSLTPEKRAWYGMVYRCTSPKSNRWHRYGGRGIKVCRRWRNSFTNFLSDMGPRPSKEYSLDRIDNDKNYTPSNSRWGTKKQQYATRASNCGKLKAIFDLERGGKMQEHHRARLWRARHNMTPQQLGPLIGYSKESIWAMERGEAPSHRGKPKRAVDSAVFRRYKCCCAAVDAYMKHQHRFDW